MAAGWSVMDALNKNSKAAAEDKPKARFRTRDISIKKMYSNDLNFYSMDGITELASQILAIGMVENMTVAYDPCDKGEYRIIAGERRWRALCMLCEKGYSEFEIATCQIKTPAQEHEETVQLIMANGYRNKTVMDILEEERRLKQSLQYMKDNNIPLSGYSLDSGRLRDVIAQIMNTTTTKIAQIESINNRLIPEFAEELKNGRLTFSAAYEISGMAEDIQKKMLERYKENGLTWKEVKEAKKEAEEAEKASEIGGQMNLPEGQQDDPEDQQGQQDDPEDQKEEEWQQAHPESITSLCYSCQRYTECNVKTSTVENCDRYVNKAEAEKTDEQRYDEEQDRIDRETKKKLREMENEEKMNNLPSDDRKKRMMRVSAKLFADIKSSKICHMIVQQDEKLPFREKDILKLLEFKEGRATGDQMRVCVTCADDSNSSSAIVEGYAVIGIMDVYDAEQMGLIDLEDEE
jgi:ParB family chromosome partitioning protein